MDLNKLFQPDSIALIGPTEKTSFGRESALTLVRSEARVYYVNPNREELFGRKCYPDLSSLPEVVDCVVFCIAARHVAPILKEAGELGTPAAVIYSSGFAEEDTGEGHAREHEIMAIARAFDMAVLGPNCMGLYSSINGIYMWAGETYRHQEKPTSGIGLACQSGFVVCQFTDLPSVACAVSTGNGNIVTLERVVDSLVADKRILLVTIYIEGMKDPMLLRQCLKRAAKAGKPVVILKSGKSEKGTKAAASHTASLTGSTRAFEALCNKYGVIIADDVQELRTLSEMFYFFYAHQPHARGCAVLNYSGGENIIAADFAEKFNIYLPPLQAKTEEHLRTVLPPFCKPGNPMDITTEMLYKVEKATELLLSYKNDTNFGMVVIGSSIELHPNRRNDILLQAITTARDNGFTIPIIIVPTLEGSRSEEYRTKFNSQNAILMPSVPAAYKALSKYLSHFEYDPSAIELEFPSFQPVHKNSTALSEFDSKLSMREFINYMPGFALAKNTDEIESIAEVVPLPWAMKINSADIPHKSDIGGVILNVRNIKDAKFAFKQINEIVQTNCPAAERHGVLVSTMQKAGLEFIIGMNNDPQLGPMILVGSGGIFAEILHDTATALAPISMNEAEHMVKSLRVYPILKGARGNQPYDIETLIRLIYELSLFAVEQSNQIQAIDLNPVFVYPEGQGIRIVDTLVVSFAESNPQNRDICSP